ncbi:hypothetical protein Leryth_003435 [Lithospermum erythrorhizon]|nr:hypothetical protein Leryth_003435 [Lithospermum erythrorhizon]
MNVIAKIKGIKGTVLLEELTITLTNYSTITVALLFLSIISQRHCCSCLILLGTFISLYM